MPTVWPENNSKRLLKSLTTLIALMGENERSYKMQETMKAWVLHGAQDLRYEDMKVPEIGPLDALIRPVMVSTCTTDVHLLETADAMPWMLGKALGHEAVGVIEKVGSDVVDFKAGDLVTIPGAAPEFRSLEGQLGKAYLVDKGPYSILNKDIPERGGSFCELVYVHDVDMNAARIEEGVTPIQALMFTDMVKTAIGTVKEAEVGLGDSVCVIGIGPVGLCAVELCAIQGAASIVGVGHRQRCRELAMKYGATATCSYKDGDIAEQAIALNGGKKFDKVLICGGNSDKVFNDALKCVGQPATISNAVFFATDRETILDNRLWAFGNSRVTIRGVGSKIMGRANNERYMKLIQLGRIHPEHLVTHKFYGLEQVPEAIKLMADHDPDVIKPIVILDKNYDY